MNKFEFEAIGRIRSSAFYPQEAPRQGVLTERSGYIELAPNRNFEQALADLEGVERIWIIFVFDRVQNWKPKVRPPLGGNRKIGVFATRSPHRPNPIGITAAKLDRIDNLTLHVSEIDLLDGTPVLDIKPYIPLADAFPSAKTGWRDNVVSLQTTITWNSSAEKKALYIRQNGGPDIAEFCNVQLGTRDIDPDRLRLTGPDSKGCFTLAFRTWRIDFFKQDLKINIVDIHSGYRQNELLPDTGDPYQDKELHRTFLRYFG